MIILTLNDGLGNQMFQYAFARKLQKTLGDDTLKFSGYHVKRTGNNERMLFQLNIPDIPFCNEEEERELEKVQERYLKKLHYYKVISRYIDGVAQRYIWKMSKKGFYTTHLLYEKQELQKTDAKIKYVVGWFQSPVYWIDMASEIRKELQVKKEPSEANRKMIEEIQSCEATCVHIRRGDYLAPEYQHLNICNEQYYMEAMERMAEQKPETVFYIFTNNHKEVQWIQENYDFSKYKVRYVDLDNPDYEELRLMYHCKNFIISNSTFSWWGQFLSDNEQKIVMAPSIWNREMSAEGIYLPDWQIIPVE